MMAEIKNYQDKSQFIHIFQCTPDSEAKESKMMVEKVKHFLKDTKTYTKVAYQLEHQML
jgi:hypothetical protein